MEERVDAKQREAVEAQLARVVLETRPGTGREPGAGEKERERGEAGCVGGLNSTATTTGSTAA